MRDISLENAGIGADSIATIKASRNLNADGLTFSRSVSSILMEATTIRLSNANFPLNSAVRLNSLKGPLDGKYPNFGSSIPAADQIGRVNFIKNASSGGNRLNTCQAFDQYGQNITIGKSVILDQFMTLACQIDKGACSIVKKIPRRLTYPFIVLTTCLSFFKLQGNKVVGKK